jgi:D-3-phosphoglycerate dehydrogenase
MHPRVWFEREVLPDLIDEVATRVTMLGPASDTPDDPYAALGDAQGIVASTYLYDAALMDGAPGLQVISRTGVGYENVDVAAATARGIAVCIAPDGPTISTAEHTVTLMLMVAKNVKRAESELRAGGRDLYARHTGIELRGRVLGLVGCGRIARRVAKISAGLGMQVMAFDPFLSADAFPAHIAQARSLEALLGAADVVSVHVPLSDETRGLLGGKAFSLMKRGSILVNTARGGIVDLGALIAALDAGQLFGAGLDVTEPEPLPPDHPLLARTDVVVTPHVAAGTAEAKRRIFRTALQQVLQVLQGERPVNLVNPEVWEKIADPVGGAA